MKKLKIIRVSPLPEIKTKKQHEKTTWKCHLGIRHGLSPLSFTQIQLCSLITIECEGISPNMTRFLMRRSRKIGSLYEVSFPQEWVLLSCLRHFFIGDSEEENAYSSDILS